MKKLLILVDKIGEKKELFAQNIAERLDCNFKTISEHTQKLAQTGLLRKSYKGRTVIHELSPYGQIIFKFLKTFQHS